LFRLDSTSLCYRSFDHYSSGHFGLAMMTVPGFQKTNGVGFHLLTMERTWWRRNIEYWVGEHSRLGLVKKDLIESDGCESGLNAFDSATAIINQSINCLENLLGMGMR